MIIIGQEAHLEKTFTEKEVLAFSEMSMDANPIHFDKEYAKTTRFKKRIVQGPFVASLIGGIIGSQLPGPGSVYINQDTNFLNPVFINDTVKVTVTVASIRKDKPIIKLMTKVVKNDGTFVIDGVATIYYIKN